MAAPARKNRRRKSQIDLRIAALGAAGVIVLAIALVLALRDTSKSTSSTSTAREASAATTNTTPTAADFTLTSLDGTVSLADYRGQYVLVNFWASWCPPCMREMPDLYAYHLAHQNDNFTLLGVNEGEDLDTVRAFLRVNQFDFPVGLDTNGALLSRYGSDSLPSSFLIGPDGVLVKTWEPGALSRDQLERDITPLLQNG